MPDDLTIEPKTVHEMRQRAEPFMLLDCREEWEHQTARIEGAMLIPMRKIPRSLEQIPKGQPIVVYCHHGMRSLDVAAWLQKQGFSAQSLSGGIDRWSMEIDPSVPRY